MGPALLALCIEIELSIVIFAILKEAEEGDMEVLVGDFEASDIGFLRDRLGGTRATGVDAAGAQKIQGLLEARHAVVKGVVVREGDEVEPVLRKIGRGLFDIGVMDVLPLSRIRRREPVGYRGFEVGNHKVRIAQVVREGLDHIVIAARAQDGLPALAGQAVVVGLAEGGIAEDRDPERPVLIFVP